MKFPVAFLCAAASAVLASPAAAARCYQHEDYPNRTIIINDPGVEPEMIWDQGDGITELGTVSAGTGIPRRYASDGENTYSYLFVDEVLVFDLEIYRPGCKAK
jgi:hypothetical protein